MHGLETIIKMNRVRDLWLEEDRWDLVLRELKKIKLTSDQRKQVDEILKKNK